MPRYPARRPQDYRSTPSLVPLNLPKDRYSYFPPAPTNPWGPQVDYWAPHLGAMAPSAPLPVMMDPFEKPFDDNDDQLNRDIRMMMEKIDRLVAKHKAESEVSLQTTFDNKDIKNIETRGQTLVE